MTTDTICAVRLDGPALRAPDGSVLARWDGASWRSDDGAVVSELTFELPRVRALVTSTARREADQSWIDAAIVDLRRLIASCDTFTSDDVWGALQFPPRESRMIGNLLARAKAEGICEPTEEHRQSARGLNHGRQVRVWRSTPALF